MNIEEIIKEEKLCKSAFIISFLGSIILFIAGLIFGIAYFVLSVLLLIVGDMFLNKMYYWNIIRHFKELPKKKGGRK